MDCAVDADRSIVLVIDEWVGECTVQFWKSRSSNSDRMARCRGCSMVVPLAYGLHIYAEEPRLSCLRIGRDLGTHTHTTILRLSGFSSEQPGWASTRRNIHPLTPNVVINHPLSDLPSLSTLLRPVPVSGFTQPLQKKDFITLDMPPYYQCTKNH